MLLTLLTHKRDSEMVDVCVATPSGWFVLGSIPFTALDAAADIQAALEASKKCVVEVTLKEQEE